MTSRVPDGLPGRPCSKLRSSAQCQGLLDIADDDDLRCTFRKRNSGRREGAKDINDYNRSNRAVGAYQQAINSDIQGTSRT